LDPDGVLAGGWKAKPAHLKAKMQVMRTFKSNIILPRGKKYVLLEI
jgi:hypothetical protein